MVGNLLSSVQAELGTDRPVPVTAVGSHDTASAVVAVPAQGEDYVYICSGTWSLVGTELAEPVLTHEAREANFTNEVGVDGRIRFLRNRMGMWMINECQRRWSEEGDPRDVPQLAADAALVSRWVEFDVDDPAFVAAGDMPSRVRLALAAGALEDPTPAEMVRSILESMASSYAQTIERVAALTGRPLATVHIVGGASKDALLCQLIADRTARPVAAGPVEATAIGNVVVQARAHGLLTGSIEELRAHVRRSQPPVIYLPRSRGHLDGAAALPDPPSSATIG